MISCPKKTSGSCSRLITSASKGTDIRSIRCSVAPAKVSFARYRPFPFWNRVRDAFIDFSH